MKNKESATFRPRSSPFGGASLVLSREETDNELLVEQSQQEGLISTDWTGLFVEAGQTVMQWYPDVQELQSYGEVELASLESWLDRVHGSDLRKVEEFFFQDWRVSGDSKKICYRFKVASGKKFETFQHVARFNRNFRSPIVTSVISRVARENVAKKGLRSHSYSELNCILRSGFEVFAHFDSLRKFLSSQSLILAERGESGEWEQILATSFSSQREAEHIDSEVVAFVRDSLEPAFRKNSSKPALRLPNLEGKPSEYFVQILPAGDEHNELCFAASFEPGLFQGSISQAILVSHLVSLSVQLQRAEKAREEIQSLLHQSERLSSIGRLATGVAHDFNNLLTVIKGHVSFVESHVEQCGDAKAQDSIAIIQNAANQAVDLSKQLLLFSRNEKTSEFEECDLNQVVSNFYKMMRRMVEECIDIELELDEEIGFIRADKGMLGQILMNLVVNARDAMPDGGKIHISTEQSTLANLQESDSSAEYVSLIIQDSGPGIPKENLSRILDPYYSTKEKGKGTGLGLANVASLMEKHGGEIDISSEEGEGARFELIFPQSAKNPKKSPQPAPSCINNGFQSDEDQESIRGYKVLLVEDESAVRKLVRKLLEMHGCSVIEATSGRKALDLWPEVCDEISVVVSDVIMPEGVSGWDLAKQLHERAPKVGILLTSGYNERAEDHGLENDPKVAFLQKPYEAQLLKSNIFQLLNNSKAS